MTVIVDEFDAKRKMNEVCLVLHRFVDAFPAVVHEDVRIVGTEDQTGKKVEVELQQVGHL